MTTYHIGPDDGRLCGVLSKEIPPVLTIQPGDTVVFKTLEGDWRWERPEKPATNSGKFYPRKPEDVGHALCGPVAINGARSGMTLAVRIDEVTPAGWGWSRVGGGTPDHMVRIGWTEPENFLLWCIDTARGTATSHLGHTVPLNPFPGVLAVCPNSARPVPTHLPGIYGANLDCKELCAGSTLYLPIEVEQAHFFVGDGHAAQGDGEAGCTAIECPMERIALTFDLLSQKLEAPVCNSPAGWITFGFHEDLTQAAYQALNRMAKLIVEMYKVNRGEAYQLASAAVDLRITQIVNGVRGVHAVLPHGRIAVNGK